MPVEVKGFESTNTSVQIFVSEEAFTSYLSAGFLSVTINLALGWTAWMKSATKKRGSFSVPLR